MSAEALAPEFGSRISLDLTWTLRYRAVRPTELLVTPRDLSDWVRAAGLPEGRPITGRDLERARDLREAIYRAASCVIAGRRVGAADRDVINQAAAYPPPIPVLTVGGTARWESPDGTIATALSAVARDAIDVLARRDGRLRSCVDDRCSLLFYDASRPGRRRWCATARCGNRANLRASRARRA